MRMKKIFFIVMLLSLLQMNFSFAAGFSSLKPDIKIEKDFSPNEYLYQDRAYNFSISVDKLKAEMEKKMKKMAKSQGRAPGNYSADINSIDSVDWYLIDEDMIKNHINTNFPNLISEQSGVNGIKKSTLRYPFYYPTDPNDGYILVSVVKFKWTALKNNSPLFSSPVSVTSYGKLHLKIMDLVPPKNFKLSPEILYGFSGKKISDYNKVAQNEGIISSYGKNPQNIVLTFFDDNPNGYSAKNGVFHNRKKVNAYIMFEGYRTKYVRFGREKYKLSGDFQKLNSTINEAAETKESCGELVWTMPISVKDIPGYSIQVEKFGPDQGKKRIGYRVILPIKGIEAYFHKFMPEFEKLSYHFATYSNLQSNDSNLMNRTPRYLRYTIAMFDSSGNLMMPSSAILNDNGVRNRLLSIYSAINGGSNVPVINEHSYFGKIIVFDNIKPNPICIMTNSRTRKTTIFTLDNGDLSPHPYSDNLDEWLFTYRGNSPVMAKLDAGKRNKFMKELVVAEGDRLVFQILGYDNISKNYISSTSTGMHGISTPLVGDSPSFYRYQTFTIKDPAADSQDSLIEKKVNGQKIYVYPDYIFRMKSSQEQSISFYITDYSIFRNKSDAISGNYNINGGFLSQVNRRALKLVFKIVKSDTTTEKMSNSEKVTREK